MKRLTVFLVTFFIIIVLAVDGCAPSPTPIAIPEVPTPTSTPPTATAVPPTLTMAPPTPTPVPPTPTPQGRTIVVTSTADSGPGTLRQALLDAQNSDTITFDPVVFKPNEPATIYVVDTELPHIHVSNLTLDASDAGVVLDGSQLQGDWVAGLQIVMSDGVTIRGLQISSFSGPGIAISGDSTQNVIGGDRSLGAGPFGQGNLLIHNRRGIDLCTNGATLNTITGNLIGTDAEGADTLGNSGSGVIISEGAHGNTIGPDNVIAHNGGGGVVVQHQGSEHNIITENSIHDNGGAGICLVEGGNAGLRAPFIFSVDLTRGIASGNGCAKCTIEIFSTQDGEEGTTYEGQVVADSNGAYTFDKGVAFRFENITSTATDTDGNTSGFSRPAGLFDITDDAMRLQEDNPFPAFLLLPKRSQFLLDNHIGVHTEGYDRYSDTEHVYRNGFKWIRIQSLTEFWGDGNEYLTFSLESIPDEVDAIISEYAENGVNIVLGLWMGAGLTPYGTTFRSDEEIERYLKYVRFVVPHFKGRIPYYEIWNEPGDIAVKDYANLVDRVVPIIRAEDPDAKIIIGAIHGDWVNGYPGYGQYQRFSLAIEYLYALIESGVVDMVDGISWHPFYDNIPSDEYYQYYPETVQEIKKMADDYGFRGEYFADEILWVTVDEPNWDNGPPVSQTIAAKYYTRAIAEHRGLDLNVTINTFFQVPFTAPIHNLCDILAGAEPTDIPAALQTSQDANVRYYAFALPDGDRIVALWTNDEAVEEDYGVSATFTISSLHVEQYIGYSVQSVIGIDVFYGFEQELVTEQTNGNIVIRDLLVKDYPIILRFTR